MNLRFLLPLIAALGARAGDLALEDFSLESFPAGEPPAAIFVVDGAIQVKALAGGKALEISGDKPEVDAGAVLGPSRAGAAGIEARILATKAGRTFPRFGIGVHGQTGFRLMLVAARQELQLLKNDQVVKAVPFAWTSGKPVVLRLTIAPADPGRWRVTGSARNPETAAEAATAIAFESDAPAGRGQPSIWGTPYSGTPIRFDHIKVANAP